MSYSNIKRGEIAPRVVVLSVKNQVRRLFLREKFLQKKISNNIDFELKMYYDPVDKKYRSLSQIFGHNTKNGLIRRINPRYSAFGILEFGKPLPKTITVEVDGMKTIFFRRTFASKEAVEVASKLEKMAYYTTTSVLFFTIQELIDFGKRKAKKMHKITPNYAY